MLHNRKKEFVFNNIKHGDGTVSKYRSLNY